MKITEDQIERFIQATEDIARALKYLGNGNCDSKGVGAIEGLSMQIKEGLDGIAAAIDDGNNQC